jgi:tellurite resistance protein TerC
VLLLAVDLGVFQRKAHAVKAGEALVWSIAWVVLSMGFGSWIYVTYGSRAGLEFFTGYLIEYALSIDNIFVFVLIFSYFAVPSRLHHRVLFWGILGALIMRGLFIFAGVRLIHVFHGILYVFGAFLVVTGIKIFLQKEAAQVDPQRNPLVRLFQRLIPMTEGYGSGAFLVRRNRRLAATPLALVLVTVETTDLVFAVDSIPAIFGVTTDWFIVFTSNICAILGLRSLYFLLAVVVDRFAYLGKGLGIVLAFIGIKLLLGDAYPVGIETSLLVVAVILAGSVGLSLLLPNRGDGSRTGRRPRGHPEVEPGRKTE